MSRCTYAVQIAKFVMAISSLFDVGKRHKEEKCVTHTSICKRRHVTKISAKALKYLKVLQSTYWKVQKYTGYKRQTSPLVWSTNMGRKQMDPRYTNVFVNFSTWFTILLSSLSSLGSLR